MPPSTQATSPLKASDRILYLDILRGIAILFIFLANIQYLSGTAFYSQAMANSLATVKADHWLGILFHVLIDGKFYSIFSILFGIGFVVQFNNLKKSSRPFVPFFTRRMLGLLLIGGIHLTFFWPGDILTLYALLGFVLILFRNFEDKRLLRWAAVLLILPIVHWCAMYFTGNFYPYALFGFVSEHAATLGFITPETVGTDRPRFDPGANIASADFIQWFQMQTRLPAMRLAMILMEGRIFKVLALFLIGIWAGRQILNRNILENTALLKRITLWGLVIGLPFSVLRTLTSYGDFRGDVFDFLYYFFYAMGVVPMACGIAAGIALIVIARPQALSWFAPVGRTALSNYLFQTVICITLFYGFGFGLTKQFGFVGVVTIALAIFVWQVLFSTMWLRYFRFGPMEWVWRQITYGKWIRLQHKTTEDKPIVVPLAAKP